MKPSSLLIVLISLFTSIAANGQPTADEVGPNAMPKDIAPVKAPFRTIDFSYPTFPDLIVKVKLRKGKMATKAIQEAIDAVAAKGGGTVAVPKGTWTTGRIELKSNVNLHLDEGCNLVFSGKIKDYQPAVFTRDEGIEIYSLGAFIYANNAENIALTGKGCITGPDISSEIYQRNQKYCLNIENIVGMKPVDQRRYDGLKTREVFLPKTFSPINCRKVLIEGVTLRQGLYWNVVPEYCDNVIIRGVTVESFGHGRTDGIDIESCSNVLIEYCSLDCQDDCYTMKSGRGWDGLRVGRPTENVVMRHCVAKRGGGGIVCGTEVAGGIKNIYVADCVFDGTDRAFRFKSRRRRGGGIDGVYVERVRASVVHSVLEVDLLGSVKWSGELAKRLPPQEITRFTPTFSNISIHDVDVECQGKLFSVQGLPERPVSNLFFGNAKARCKSIGSISDVKSFSLKDVLVHTADTAVTIDGCEKASFYGFNNADTGRPVKVEQEGMPSPYLSVQEVPLQKEGYTSVKSGQVWLDNNGRPIQAHGFQLFYDSTDSLYYWYGVDNGRTIPGTNRLFGGVRLYTSHDFYNWTDEGLIIAPDSIDPMSPIHYSQKVERPHILYCKATGKYVCWIKSQSDEGYFVVLQADHFRGSYSVVRLLQPEGYTVGDFDMYADPTTGKGYVWFERPHWELICAELSDDYTGVSRQYSEHFVGKLPPYTRESPAHFVRGGKHYLFTSGTTGYTSNPTETAVFDNYHGTYTVIGDPHVGDSTASSFNSQITCVLRIPGKKDLYVALADRWEPQTTGTDMARKAFKSKEKAYLGHRPLPQDESRQPKVRDLEYVLIGTSRDIYNATYTFLPIRFDDGTPLIEWKDSWRIEDYE